MEGTINRLEVLQGLLRAALTVKSVEWRIFDRGWITPDEVIVTHRFIILIEGAMDYTVEGVTRRVEAGEQVFAPAWCRRQWRVPKRTGRCRLLWCDFSAGPETVPARLFRRRPERNELQREIAAFEGLRRLAGGGAGREAALRMEGELKAALARFWPEARTEGGEPGREGAAHPEVARARAWLERHYAEPGALEDFYRTVELSPNHFRVLFRKGTGETVQAVLARLRLRRARYLVRETTLPMKRIAAETGFAEPLYFSKQYRKFWGRAATEDRAGGGRKSEG